MALQLPLHNVWESVIPYKIKGSVACAEADYISAALKKPINCQVFKVKDKIEKYAFSKKLLI